MISSNVESLSHSHEQGVDWLVAPGVGTWGADAQWVQRVSYAKWTLLATGRPLRLKLEMRYRAL